jgi:16S rRNA (guanine527-N7)-methyltransferase
MPALEPAQIAALLSPFIEFSDELQLQGSERRDLHTRSIVPPAAIGVTEKLLEQLAAYLDLLLKWNARTNLTSVRSAEQIVQRHFGESLFAGRHLLPKLSPDVTLLDLGSGAGFPGLPIQLLAPYLRVTLAESQNKKASFLREIVRTLGLKTEVYASRVESLPDDRLFEAVTLRAVDNMPLAIELARKRLVPGGWMAILAAEPEMLPDAEVIPVPNAEHTFLLLWQQP